MNIKQAHEILLKVGRELVMPSIQYFNLIYWYEGKSSLGMIKIEEYEKALQTLNEHMNKNDHT